MNWKLVALLVAVFFLIFSMVFPKALYGLGKEFVDKISFIKFSNEQKELNEQQKTQQLGITCNTLLANADQTNIQTADEKCMEFIEKTQDAKKKIEIINNLIKLYQRYNLVEQQGWKYEQLILLARDNDEKAVFIYQALEFYYGQKNLDKAEEKVNLLKNTANSKFSLFALYYLAKINEEKQQYVIAVSYYDTYIIEYDKLTKEKIITEKEPFIKQHPIESVVIEKENMLAKINK